jgi:protein TonB
MTTFSPAKKAFLMASILYALLLLLGYVWYTSTSPALKKESVKLTALPVTLSMFQPPTPIVVPVSIPKVVEEAQQPKPITPVDRQTEMPITPVKISPPPKKTEVKQKELPKKTLEKPKEVFKEVLKETPPKPSVKPSIAPKKIPPPTQAIESTKELTSKPIIHPNQSASAEQSYLSELNTIIAQHAYNSYPRRAKRRNWQGEVLIQFTLLPNGRITHLSITESSGRQLLDNAALQIFQVKMNQQFKPFPKEIVRTQWRIEVPVSYHLN